MIESNLLTGRKKMSKDLLMHFDGEGLSTYFRDEGGRSFSLIGTPEISTTQSKFGGSSGYFYVDGLILSAPMELYDDYTIEAWVYLLEYPVSRAGIAGSTVTTSKEALMIATTGRLAYWLTGTGTSGSVIVPAGTGTVPLGAWHHIAATRQDRTHRLFSNGIKILEKVETSKPMVTVNRLMRYAADDSTDGFKGYVDEMRILDGRAIYTGDFAVPTTPFTL